MANRLDILIFGATGFTGRYAVKYAISFCKEYNLTFGIAGRRKEALEAVIEEYTPDMDVPIIVADLENNESIIEMTRQAKVLVNCCGPYRFYGKQIVSACISTATHQVDVTGEPQYMEEIQLAKHDSAREVGIYIINACGLDSIPADMGVIFAQQKFTGVVNSIETYLKFGQTDNLSSSPHINYGTWESLVYSVAHWNELQKIREKLCPDGYPKFYPKLKQRAIVHKSDISEGWSTIFLGADSSVIYRTQNFFYQRYNKRPVQVKTYMTFKSIFTLLTVFLEFALIAIMTRIRFTRNLLLKYPGIFSLGFVIKDNPKAETLGNLEFMFKACGWTNKLDDIHDVYKSPPHKELITKVTASDTVYDTTCIALLLSAIMILKESDKMPDKGGVYTPGAAFASTSLIEKLHKNGIKFEVVSSKENRGSSKI